MVLVLKFSFSLATYMQRDTFEQMSAFMESHLYFYFLAHLPFFWQNKRGQQSLSVLHLSPFLPHMMLQHSRNFPESSGQQCFWRPAQAGYFLHLRLGQQARNLPSVVGQQSPVSPSALHFGVAEQLGWYFKDFFLLTGSNPCWASEMVILVVVCDEAKTMRLVTRKATKKSFMVK